MLLKFPLSPSLAVSRRRPRGACTRGTSSRRSWPGSWRGPRAVRWCCGWRISIGSAPSPRSSTACSGTSSASGSSGIAVPISSMIGTRPTVRPWRPWPHGICCTPAIAPGPTCMPPRRPIAARSRCTRGRAAPCRLQSGPSARPPGARRLCGSRCPTASWACATSCRGITVRTWPATAATSSCAAPTGPSPISWPWWWTTGPRG